MTKVKHLVDHIEIWINPLANPDGTYFLSDTSVAGATRFNSNQIDLNRDFPELDGCYIGKIVSRQPETIAMMDFMEGIRPTLAANFHGGCRGSKLSMGYLEPFAADDAWYRNISRCYADTVHATGLPDT